MTIASYYSAIYFVEVEGASNFGSAVLLPSAAMVWALGQGPIALVQLCIAFSVADHMAASTGAHSTLINQKPNLNAGGENAVLFLIHLKKLKKCLKSLDFCSVILILCK